VANAYRATQRMQEAEGACQEALCIRRELAKANPEAYLPNVAVTLSNLAVLYRDTQRIQAAEDCSREAECILEPAWQTNPTVYGDQIARILCARALLCALLGKSEREACALARRAWAAAYDADIKENARALLDQFCAGGRS
jgi:Tetratricopeptide repeat